MKKVLLWCGLLLSTLVVGYFLYTTFFVISKEEKLKDSEARNSISVHSLDNVKALEMPVFEIFTEGNAPIVSKEEYINGKLTISNVDENLQLINEPLQIRGRGLSSWFLVEKKSYRIKFDSKNNLLGQGKEKARNWTLLAMHYDKSFLRNEAAYFFASKLSGIPFVSSSSFVELWLNGEYQGVYEVCDQIQVHKGRVDIDDSGDEEDIGYLVEIDMYAKDNVITTSNGETYEIKSNYVNSKQRNFIADYLSNCLKAIEARDKNLIDNLIDIPSAVDCYIVEEFMKNHDAGGVSFYFTKPKGDKLHFGPVWDFDLSSGNADNDNQDPAFRSYKYTYVGNLYFTNLQQSSWYSALRKCDWFNDMVKAKWEEVRKYGLQTADHVEKIATKYKGSFERNFIRWPIFDQKILREPEEIMAIKSFDNQVDYLANWLRNRVSWLDDYYAGTTEDIKPKLLVRKNIVHNSGQRRR